MFRAIALRLSIVAALWRLSRVLLPPSAVRFAAGTEDGGYWHIASQ